MTTDEKSYKRRLKDRKAKASIYLATGEYEKLLMTAAELMALKQGLFEVYYQQEMAKDREAGLL